MSEHEGAVVPTERILGAARSRKNSEVPWLLALALSFGGGLQIMLLEMCGFRVLQTHLGSSVVVQVYRCIPSRNRRWAYVERP